DLRRADDVSSRVPDWRDSEGDVDASAVFPHADGVVMLDRLARPDARDDDLLFVAPFRWNDDREGLADRFRGRVAEDPLGGSVPGTDDPVQIRAIDGIVTRLDNGGEPLPGEFVGRPGRRIQTPIIILPIS